MFHIGFRCFSLVCAFWGAFHTSHVANQIIPQCKMHASVLMFMSQTSKTLRTDRGPPAFGDGFLQASIISSVAPLFSDDVLVFSLLEGHVFCVYSGQLTLRKIFPKRQILFIYMLDSFIYV